MLSKGKKRKIFYKIIDIFLSICSDVRMSAEHKGLTGPINTVVVANNREYFSPFDKLIPLEVSQEYIRSDVDEADMDIMWAGDNKIVLTVERIDPEFTGDVFNLFGFRNTTLVVPHNGGAGLCEDTLADGRTFRSIANSIKESLDPQIIPWGHTSHFQRLRETLYTNGARFRTPETPTNDALWIPDYFDTKAGSRELMLLVKARHPELDVKIPEGYVCGNLEEALGKTDYFLSNGRGVVFKANLGAAGLGVFIYKPEDLDTPGKVADMKRVLRENLLFQNDRVVIEERIDADFTLHGVDPSVDALVKEDGSVEIQAVDAMVIHHEGDRVSFYGCIGGKGLFPTEKNLKIRDFTKAVGQELSSMGYRGWFDTDYVLATDGQFSPTEANLRRTSMSYVVDLAKLLYGNNWEQTISVRTNDKFIRNNIFGMSYHQLKETLSDIMYPIKGAPEGVIITQSMRSMYGRGKFGYVIFGDGQDRTLDIERVLEKKLERV